MMSDTLKPLVFMGTSHKDLQALPDEVRQVFGYAIYQAQRGKTPSASVKMTGMKGVIELKETDEDGTYRAMYTAKIKGKIVVLHAFQKKSKKGIATPKADMDLIRTRLKQAQDLWG